MKPQDSLFVGFNPNKKKEPEIYLCDECGAPALFGYGVNLMAGIRGNWRCGEHRRAPGES